MLLSIRPKRIKECTGPATQSENGKATKARNRKKHILLLTKLISSLVTHAHTHAHISVEKFPAHRYRCKCKCNLIRPHTKKESSNFFRHFDFSFEVKPEVSTSEKKQNFDERNLSFDLKEY